MNETASATPIEITVNGEVRPWPGGSLAQLLAQLGVTPERGGVAAAVNGEIVHRGQWDGHRLADGDRVEIVGAVQGG